MSAQWVGLLGVVVGAVLTAVIGWVLRREEYDRQARAKWDVDKRAAYAAFLGAANDYERLVFTLQSDVALRASPESVNRSPLDAAFTRMQAALTQVVFLGTDPLPWLALEHVMALVPSFGELDADHEFGPYGWAAVDFNRYDDEPVQLMDTRGRFLAAARKEIGLGSAHAYLTHMTTAR